MNKKDNLKLLHPSHTLSLILTFAMFWIAIPTLEAQSSPRFKDWPNTDFENSVIDLSEIRSGGPPKDGIPSIDHPEFVSVDSAIEWLNLREPVIVLDILGEAKAYPLTDSDLARDRK